MVPIDFVEKPERLGFQFQMAKAQGWLSSCSERSYWKNPVCLTYLAAKILDGP
jgi:hypothetical protein